MALERERRAGAGNRMSKLLDEEEDEFYKTTYGGFEELDDDDDYRSEVEAEDLVDSDFSIEENDELLSDGDDTEPRRRRRLVTKAYKEPTVAVVQKPEKPKVTKPKSKQEKREKFRDYSIERKTVLRRSTAAKSAATQQLIKERSEEGRKRKSRRTKKRDYYQPTQDELLAEAKLTEIENLKSLETYKKLELEKKKTRIVKTKILGPIIRYHSVTMPLIEDIAQESPITVDGGDEDKPGTNPNKESDVDVEEKVAQSIEPIDNRCERTFITFLDPKSFDEAFPSRPALKVPKVQMDPINGKRARYFDPVTKQPYSNISSFKILRSCYYKYLDENGNKDDPDVAAWLNWRKSMKESREKNSGRLEKLDLSGDNLVTLEPAHDP